MSEHTPGPWNYAARLSGSENHKGFDLGGDGGWLGMISPRDQDGVEGEANARLIAAAPGLLAALEGGLDIMGYLVDFLFSDRTEPLDAGRVRQWRDKAREAIKQAKGGS